MPLLVPVKINNNKIDYIQLNNLLKRGDLCFRDKISLYDNKIIREKNKTYFQINYRNQENETFKEIEIIPSFLYIYSKDFCFYFDLIVEFLTAEFESLFFKCKHLVKFIEDKKPNLKMKIDLNTIVHFSPFIKNKKFIINKKLKFKNPYLNDYILFSVICNSFYEDLEKFKKETIIYISPHCKLPILNKVLNKKLMLYFFKWLSNNNLEPSVFFKINNIIEWKNNFYNQKIFSDNRFILWYLLDRIFQQFLFSLIKTSGYKINE